MYQTPFFIFISVSEKYIFSLKSLCLFLKNTRSSVENECQHPVGISYVHVLTSDIVNPC